MILPNYYQIRKAVFPMKSYGYAIIFLCVTVITIFLYMNLKNYYAHHVACTRAHVIVCMRRSVDLASAV